MNKLIIRYKELSLPVKASLWYIFCSILQNGISIVTMPIFTRLMTVEQYGLVTVYNSWRSIVLIPATFYLAAGVFNNGMLKYDYDRDGFTSSIQTLMSLLTILCVFIYILFSNQWNGLLGMNSNMMFMMFADIFFSSALSVWSLRLRYEYKYSSVVLVTMLLTIMSPVLSIYFMSFTQYYKSEAKILGTVLADVIICGIIYLINIYKGRILVKLEYWVYSLKFNIPLIPHYLSTIMLNQVDRVMINNICGTDKAGIYGVSYNIALVINIVVTSINSSFVPWTYQKLKEKKYKEIRNVSFQLEIIVGLLCLVFSLFAPELIKVLAPSEYYSAIWIIPPVSISVLFVLMYGFFSNIEFYYEKTHLVMIASLLAAVSNIILNYIFIPLFGFIAAGYTTLACYIIYGAVHYFFMIKICKERGLDENPYDGKKMWLTAILFSVAALLCTLLYSQIILRYGVIATVLIVAIVKRSQITKTILLVKTK